MGFIDKIITRSKKADSLVCVGLDTDPLKIPEHLAPRPPVEPGDYRGVCEGVLRFNEMIINATSDFVCAYKPNAAFYEAMGSSGIDLLEKTCSTIPDEIPIILDVKRGDIGNSAARYATAAYDIFGADAVTVNPYMGFDAVRPFLRENKAVFVLCVTSNPSAEDFQFLKIYHGDTETRSKDYSFIDTTYETLYEHVARAAVSWSKEGEIGLVMGATRPKVMQIIRDIIGDMPVLVPGIGAQGGDIESVIAHCGGSYGRTIINSSRSILYASQGHDFAERSRDIIIKLRNEINRYRRAID